jgi:hypothetical protein
VSRFTPRNDETMSALGLLKWHLAASIGPASSTR